MPPLLAAHTLAKAHGSLNLFQGLSFNLSKGDRVGLIGPNGAGKSSLLKILAGIEKPDSGYLTCKQNLKVGYASQSPQFPSMPIQDFLVAESKAMDPFEARTQAGILLGKGGFEDFDLNASVLSGGWKKRLDILRALMNDPDLLLLDEPTNHLDLEGILWLETFLSRLSTPYLVISHDRYFLENVANKMMELNPCYPEGLLICDGNISTFMERKQVYLEAQEKKQRGLAFKVREETSWLKSSPKARTTKSRSRILQAYHLMEELDEIKQQRKVRKAGIDFTGSERLTRKLIVANNLGKSMGGKELFQKINLMISPGTRLGLVGKNGTGKTTLLKVLAGMIPPDVGTVKFAENLQIVHFDQHREQLPPDITLKEALTPHGDTVQYRGRQIHVNSWAKRFLFPPERVNMTISHFSGGERARILIAKLMLRPADVLFLDEPTNDLDIQTLEIIEESLLSFPGAVVMISHDRCLMDRICSKILVLGEDLENPFFDDYTQWERASSISTPAKPITDKPAKEQARKQPRRLSYNEQRELDMMEGRIQGLEEELAALGVDVEREAFTPEDYRRLAEKQEQIDKLYKRWQELLDKSGGI